MTTFDFGDWKGRVPAHQHPNGGGWVADTAHVDETAYVGPNARVYGNAQVRGYAQVKDCAAVRGWAQVSGWAKLIGRARVTSYAEISGDALVSGNAVINNTARVSNNACVYGVNRSDGHTFCYVPDKDGTMRVIAGCRYFTMEEAREHWQKKRGGIPLGAETMAILDFLEALSKIKPEGCV